MGSRRSRAPLAHLGDPLAADVVVGVPWDGGTGLRGGARHGPQAIREASLRFPLWADRQPATGMWRPSGACWPGFV